MVSVDHELASIDLDLAPNEASGLLPVADRPLLAAHDWDQAFWVVLDEGPVEASVAVVGHAGDADVGAGWSIERLHAIVQGDQVKTEDAEAVARHDGELHVVTGNIDAREKGSVLLEDYPSGAHTMATHWRCALPGDRRAGHLAPERVREFPDLSAIEGIAVDDHDRIFYVSDEDEGVIVKHTHLVVTEEG
jgi:hypothetical protein